MKTSPSLAQVQRFIEMILAVFVGSTLAFAGLGHITNPMLFLGNVMQYDLVPHFVATVVGSTLPWCELLLAIMLLLNLERTVAFRICALLTLAFVVAQASAMSRGLNIDCGCFGALAERAVGAQSLSLAVSMFLASVLGSFLCGSIERRNTRLDKRSQQIRTLSTGN